MKVSNHMESNLANNAYQGIRCSEKSRGNKELLVPKETTRQSEAKSKKLSTPYPHKYKTVLCKFWAKGYKCPFGNECNYAHGQNQLADKI